MDLTLNNIYIRAYDIMNSQNCLLCMLPQKNIEKKSKN